MSKRFASALVIALCFAVKVQAAMVSFMVIETGLSHEAGRNIHSEIWESALMDVFFDAGHIVCNTPILRLEKKPADDLQKLAAQDMKEALEGGAEFFIVARLDYAPETASPVEISLAMFRTRANAKIYENKITGKTYKSDKEEFDDLKKIARGLIPLLK